MSGFQHWASDTGLPSCLDPSAELVGVRVTRRECHHPDLILSNLCHLKHIQGSQPCFQLKGILDELALSYCCYMVMQKRKEKSTRGVQVSPKTPSKITSLLQNGTDSHKEATAIERLSCVLTFSAWQRGGSCATCAAACVVSLYMWPCNVFAVRRPVYLRKT